MTKYAKIKNNLLEYAPTNKGSVSNWINDIQVVLAEGYLPVELQDIPEGKYQVGYEVVNGVIVRKLEVIPEPLPLTKEETQALRREAYREEVDPLMSEYDRKKTFNLFEEGEEEELIKAIKDKVAEIKERFPYPEENI